MAKRSKGAADLALSPLAQCQMEGRLCAWSVKAHVGNARRRGAPVLELDPFRKTPEDLIAHGSSGEDNVFALAPERGMEQRLGRRTVVGEQHETFGVVVEATHRKNPREAGRKKLDHGGTTPRIVPGGEDASRFVDEPVARPLCLKEHPVETNLIHRGISAVAEARRHSVHGDPTAREKGFAASARRHTRSRENLLQASPHPWG